MASTRVVLSLLVLLGTLGACSAWSWPSWLPLFSSASSNDFDPPSWYHGKDGPTFEVLQTSDNVELRRYMPSKWVSTNVTNAKFDDAYKDGTKRLDDYWKGGNQGETKVESTVPTFMLCTFQPDGPERTLNSQFQVEYFLPHALSDSPPTPKTEELKVIDVQKVEVWVKVFGGYAKEQDVINNAFSFIEDLKKQGVKIMDGMFGVAFYDDPLHLINRHNEIWVWTAEAPAARSRIRKIPGWVAARQ